ncbi:uncharacterized protein LOC129794854 [Lutzomyia longipalpis]|uniref:uncharacterized protein LOC129794854 n=1 Tax=Lutzomyia longipalpis TaxID=7200 RepID=UPI002484653A|nr:uncharacterized protein LOC129794854 [Lutzomyia longipalpis]
MFPPSQDDINKLRAVIESWDLSRPDLVVKILVDNCFLLHEMLLIEEQDIVDLFPSPYVHDRVQFRVCITKWAMEVETANRILSLNEEPEPEVVQIAVKNCCQDRRDVVKDKVQAYLNVMNFPGLPK